jgi:hypothetical protein
MTWRDVIRCWVKRAGWSHTSLRQP